MDWVQKEEDALSESDDVFWKVSEVFHNSVKYSVSMSWQKWMLEVPLDDEVKSFILQFERNLM